MRTRSVLVAAMLVAGLAGCHYSTAPTTYGSDTSFKAIAGRPSPELSATVDRDVDITKNFAVLRNVNLRGLWDDVQRSIYIDHPSRLSPYPIIYTSGNPR